MACRQRVGLLGATLHWPAGAARVQPLALAATESQDEGRQCSEVSLACLRAAGRGVGLAWGAMA